MKYENRKTGKIATLDQLNEKFKTALLIFEDGTNTTISTSTLKRWWKEIPEEETTEQEVKQEASKYVEASAAITKELNKNNSKSLKEMVDAQADEDVAGDGTPLAEVGKEIAEQAKEKVTKHKEVKTKRMKEKKLDKPVFDSTDFQNYIISIVKEMGGDITQRRCKGGTKDMPVKVFTCETHMFMKMAYSKHRVSISTKGVTLTPDETLNAFYDSRFYFTEDTKEARDKMRKLIAEAYKSQQAINSSKAIKVKTKKGED